MTTEITRTPGATTRAGAPRPPGSPALRSGGTRTLLVTAVVIVLVGAGVAAAAGAVEGRPAALGAALGALLAVVVLGGGGLLLDLVAGVLPAASLLVALLTYVLQLLVLGVVLLGLERSGLLGAELDRTWLGGALILATLGWLVVATIAFARRRVPVFDLPEAGRS